MSDRILNQHSVFCQGWNSFGCCRSHWSILITTTRQTVCQSQQMSNYSNFYLSYSSDHCGCCRTINKIRNQKDGNDFRVTCSCLRWGCLCNLYHYKMTWSNMLRHLQQRVFLVLHADFNCWTVGKCGGRFLVEHMRNWIPTMVWSGVTLLTPDLTIFWDYWGVDVTNYKNILNTQYKQ